MPSGVYKRSVSELKRLQKGLNTGRKASLKTKQKMREAHKGDKAYNWKGENVGYIALHTWLKTWRGKPNKCEICKRTDCKKYEWANKDHKYRRIFDDWLRLCTSCHRQYDIKNNNYSTYQGKRIGSTSIYKGVCWAEKINRKNPWMAYIDQNHKRIHIGYFDTELNASKAIERVRRMEK